MKSLPTRSTHPFTKFFLALLILFLVAGIPAIYFFQQAKLDETNRKNQELTTKVRQLEADKVVEDQTSVPPPTPVSPPSTMYQSPKGVKLTVTNPLANTIVTSPLVVAGTVPGNWSFEASFPVKLLDANGAVIAQRPASLRGDWMTDKQVPFSVSLTFTRPATSTGSLVLLKDNPSGLPQNDDSVTIPVKF